MAGKAKVHGSPLGEEEAKLTKKNLGLPEDEKFYFPEDVKQHFQNIISEKIKEYEEWNEKFKLYKEKYPEDFQSLEKFLNEEYAKNCDYSVFNTDKSEMATREAIGISLNALADVIPNFMGGSADLAPSTKTYLNDYEDFDAGQPGRNLRFGIREHAMGAIVNGITLYLDGALRGYGSTFLVFSDYMKHTVRLSALMEIPSLFIFTHDSIGVGEDGPTHQPVEHVAALRGIPEHYVIRPADFYETAYFLLWFMKNKRSASFVLSRQKLPVLNGLKSDNVLKGGYVLEDAENYDVILVATGSEVSLALESKKVLEKEGIKARVVSMPCKELFEEQEETYKNEVINKEKPVLVIEAGVKHGWEGYYCNKGDIISVDKFGASAPYKVVFDKYGFNTENVVKKVKKLLNK
jgi:transketolase